MNSDVTILHHDDFSPGLEAENFLTPDQRDYRLLIYRLADNAHEVYFYL